MVYGTTAYKACLCFFEGQTGPYSGSASAMAGAFRCARQLCWRTFPLSDCRVSGFQTSAAFCRPWSRTFGTMLCKALIGPPSDLSPQRRKQPGR
jgi:hypothetical protein